MAGQAFIPSDLEPSTPHSTVFKANLANSTPALKPVVHNHGGHLVPAEITEAPHKNHPSHPHYLPPQLEQLSWLAGKWIVFEPGRGIYPTITSFTYSEQIEFLFNGQPMLDYKAESWNPNVTPKTLLHREQGFLRVKPGSNKVALVLSHNFGVSEVLEGRFDGTKLTVETTGIRRMSFAKDPAVVRTRRKFEYYPESEELEHIMEMETTDTPYTEHLRIKYKRGTHQTHDGNSQHAHDGN